MSYASMVAITNSTSLKNRLRMCAVQEITPGVNPEWWVAVHVDRLATQPGWGDAFASAIANNITDPGDDESVITDGMILSAVQALIAQDNSLAAAAKQAAEDAAAAEIAKQQAADEALRQQQRDDETWRLQQQAQLAAATSTVPQESTTTTETAKVTDSK